MRNKLQKNIKHYFRKLNQLQQCILICYIQRDYLEQRDRYEAKIHSVRKKLFDVMKKIRRCIENQSYLLNLLEDLYEIIFSLNTLKLHVDDFSTFEVAKNEFKLLSQEIEKIFATNFFKTNGSIKLDEFTAVIESFEELYRSTLQIVSQEPMVFLFFIQDLLALRDVLQNLFQELTRHEAI